MGSDNTVLNSGSGGQTYRSLGDASNDNWAVGIAAYATTLSPGANVLQIVTPSFGLPTVLPATQNIVVDGVRNGGVLHRSAITSADHIANPSQLSSGTGETITSGSLVSGTGYYYTFLWRSIQGCTLVASITGATTPGGSNNALRLALGSPPTGATNADIFLSTTSTGPAWVCSPTTTQLSNGGATCTTVGTIGTSGSAPSNSIDIGIVGTGLPSSNALYSYNNAYLTPAQASITPISCVGYSKAHVHAFLSVSDFRSLPALTLVPFFIDQTSSNYFAGQSLTLAIGGNAGATLYQDFALDVDGSTDLAILIDTISGQSASCSIWVELM